MNRDTDLVDDFSKDVILSEFTDPVRLTSNSEVIDESNTHAWFCGRCGKFHVKTRRGILTFETEEFADLVSSITNFYGLKFLNFDDDFSF